MFATASLYCLVMTMFLFFIRSGTLLFQAYQFLEQIIVLVQIGFGLMLEIDKGNFVGNIFAFLCQLPTTELVGKITQIGRASCRERV